MTPAHLAADLADQIRTRDERDFWRRFAMDALHSGIAAYQRVTTLERQLQETRDELRRYSRERAA